MTCEYGVDIPRNLALYNTAYTYTRSAEERRSYAGMGTAIRAQTCTASLPAQALLPDIARKRTIAGIRVGDVVCEVDPGTCIGMLPEGGMIRFRQNTERNPQATGIE